MKKYFIILSSIYLICNNYSFGYERYYTQNPYYYPNQSAIRPIYHPYYNYNDPYYRYYPTNNSYQYNNAKRLRRINRIRLLNQLRNNFVTWNNSRKNNGNMTGYSVPITQNDFLNTTNTTNKNYNKMPKNSYNTEIFSSPQTTDYYYEDGQIIRKNDNVSGAASVKIIYD